MPLWVSFVALSAVWLSTIIQWWLAEFRESRESRRKRFVLIVTCILYTFIIAGVLIYTGSHPHIAQEPFPIALLMLTIFISLFKLVMQIRRTLRVRSSMLQRG